MSKKKKLSNEEKLSSVISDINAFTNKDRGKKNRPGNLDCKMRKGVRSFTENMRIFENCVDMCDGNPTWRQFEEI